MSYINRKFTWDFDSLKRFYEKYIKAFDNMPDEEDLTINNNRQLLLKNRDNIDGMGYIILRKNKSFAEQVTKENTIYEIRYDFILENNITIPDNCILKFNGGSISAGNGENMNTIIGSPNIIGYHCLHGIILNGVYPSGIKVSWFANPVEAFNLNHNITNVPYSGGGVMISSIYVDESFETSVSLNVKNRTVIYGNCTNAIRIVMTDDTKPVFDLESFDKDEIDFHNLNIIGGKYAIYSNSGIIVKINFQHLFCFGQEDYAFYFDNSEICIDTIFDDVFIHYSGGGIYMNANAIYGNTFKKVSVVSCKKYGFTFKQTGFTGIYHNIFQQITYDSGKINDNVEAAFYMSGNSINNLIITDGWFENIKKDNNDLALPIKFVSTGTIQSDISASAQININNITFANNNIQSVVAIFAGIYKNVSLKSINVDSPDSLHTKKYIDFIDNATYVSISNSYKSEVRGATGITNIDDIKSKCLGYTKDDTLNIIGDYFVIPIDVNSNNERYIVKQLYSDNSYKPINTRAIGGKFTNAEGIPQSYGTYYQSSVTHIIIPKTVAYLYSSNEGSSWYINIDVFRGTNNLRIFQSVYNYKTTGNIESLGSCVNIERIYTYNTNIYGDWMNFVISQILNGRVTCDNGIDIGYINRNILLKGTNINATSKCKLYWDNTTIIIKDNDGNGNIVGQVTLPEIFTYNP